MINPLTNKYLTTAKTMKEVILYSLTNKYLTTAKTMKEVILTKTNEYRAKHHAGPLTWDDTLAGVAQGWAQHLADTEKFEHSDDSADAG